MKWQLLHAAHITKSLMQDDGQAQTVIVMPSTDADQASRAAQQLASRATDCPAMILVVMDDEGEGFTDIANRVYRATHSDYFGYVAQDAYAGRRWLSLALQTLTQQHKGLLGFNDGKWGGALAAFGLGQRSWLDHNYDGDLFYHGYTQHYADTELTMLAIGNAQYSYNPNAVLVEVDWGKDAKAVQPFDRLLYAQRKLGWIKEHVTHPACLELFS
jgi:hypothetical protein